MKNFILIALGMLFGCNLFAEPLVTPAYQAQYYIISPYHEPRQNKTEEPKESFSDVSADYVWSILNNTDYSASQVNGKSIGLEKFNIKPQSLDMVKGRVADRSMVDSEEVIKRANIPPSLTIIQQNNKTVQKEANDKSAIVYKLPQGATIGQMNKIALLDKQNLQPKDGQKEQYEQPYMLEPKTDDQQISKDLSNAK